MAKREETETTTLLNLIRNLTGDYSIRLSLEESYNSGFALITVLMMAAAIGTNTAVLGVLTRCC